MIPHIQGGNEAKAWIKRNNGPGEIIKVTLGTEHNSAVTAYLLYTAFDTPDYLGQILFDTEGYWIYDGNVLHIAEQEQVARFIIQYAGAL